MDEQFKVQWGEYVPVSGNFVLAPEIKPTYIQFFDVVRIGSNGRIELLKDASYDDAAKAFWKAVELHAPQWTKQKD